MSTDFQLCNPAGWIAPMPSHELKLRASTPSRGITPKPTNITSAGSAIHATDPLRPPVRVDGAVARAAAGGASAVTGR